jgi:hypothetical protein
MEQEATDKHPGTFNIKINFDNVRYKTLPSPARFLELQGVKDAEDIERITRASLIGDKAQISEILKDKYSKNDTEVEFIRITYNELLFKYVMESVIIN